tara:strand:+ start:56 stop:247 length:192 start_codon:yes stop_codon:yes gene_type:complete
MDIRNNLHAKDNDNKSHSQYNYGRNAYQFKGISFSSQLNRPTTQKKGIKSLQNQLCRLDELKN